MSGVIARYGESFAGAIASIANTRGGGRGRGRGRGREEDDTKEGLQAVNAIAGAGAIAGLGYSTAADGRDVVCDENKKSESKQYLLNNIYIWEVLHPPPPRVWVFVGFIRFFWVFFVF